MSKAKILAGTVSTGGSLENPTAIPAANIAGLATVATTGSYNDLSDKPTITTTATNLAGGSAGTVPYQSAAGATAMLAAGTAGQVLTSAGAAAPAWASVSSSPVPTMVVLTSGTSWTAPAGVTKIKIIVTGGGGGGASAGFGARWYGMGAGGAGGTAIKIFTVVAGSSYTYAIGAAGASDTAGGNSTFTVGATTVTGGGGTSSGANSFDGADGGTATNGDINILGGSGNPGGNLQASASFAAYSSSGSGGASFWGGGGAGRFLDTGGDGNTGRAFGSGGGGSCETSATVRVGGAGKAGVIVIEY